MDFVSKQHEEIVQGLNEIVLRCNVPLEGNIFYRHHQDLRTDTSLFPRFAKKREQLALIAQRKSRVMEIGHNAGHSAAIMLCANPDLVYTGIDIGWHSYTQPCAQYLASKFPGRVQLLMGDSAKVYPLTFDLFADYDLIHIDGGHSLEHFRIDLVHALTLPCTNPNRHILIDDTNDEGIPWLPPELRSWINAGHIAIDTLDGLLADHGDHLLVKPLR